MFRAVMVVIIDVVRTQTDGFLLGLVLAWVLGATANWLRKMRGKIQAPYKPMVVTMETKKTPAQIVNESWGAQWLVRLFWWALIVGIAYLAWDTLK